MPTPRGAEQRSRKPGRRQVDHDRVVTWRDYLNLRRLLWATLIISCLFGLGWGVTAYVLFHQVNRSRAYTASALCAAVDGVRASTRDGFHTIRGVAAGAGLGGQGLRELHGIVVRLDNPPAAQDCHVIVRAVKDVQTGPTRTEASPTRSP